MSAPKIMIVTAATTFLSTLVCAMPLSSTTSNETPKNITRMSVDQFLNKTVCPIRVVYDEKEDRVPRIIKTMKCAAEPSHCSDRNVISYDCCQAKDSDHPRQCVEMYDKVLVYYPSTNRNDILMVSVGCSCKIDNVTHAQTVPTYGPPSATPYSS